jgi:hypothetical protein
VRTVSGGGLWDSCQAFLWFHYNLKLQPCCNIWRSNLLFWYFLCCLGWYEMHRWDQLGGSSLKAGRLSLRRRQKLGRKIEQAWNEETRALVGLPWFTVMHPWTLVRLRFRWSVSSTSGWWSGAHLKGLTFPKDLQQRGTFGGP